MANEPYSAEKDLLRLIENPAEIESGRKGSDASAIGNNKVSRFLLRRRSREGGAKRSSFSLASLGRKQILQLLTVATVCVFIYFIFTINREYAKLKNTKNLAKFTTVSETKAKNSTKSPIEVSTLSDSAENVPAAPVTGSVRNIFKPGSTKKEEEKPEGFTAALSDYRLVGISQAPNPTESYAMVKNAKTNLTFFLKKGEALDGMELLEIHENKLVLNVRGKEVELR